MVCKFCVTNCNYKYHAEKQSKSVKTSMTSTQM